MSCAVVDCKEPALASSSRLELPKETIELPLCQHHAVMLERLAGVEMAAWERWNDD